jgi:hypothetical protein
MMKLPIYVPVAARIKASIRPGSGIVGSPDGDRITIDYEGAIYDQAALVHFADRVAQAASRHVTNYPTVARMWVKPEDLAKVGTWDGLEGEVHLGRSGATALAAWLGVAHIAPDELLAGGARYEKRRAIKAALAGGDRIAIANARAYAAREHIDDLA